MRRTRCLSDVDIDTAIRRYVREQYGEHVVCAVASSDTAGIEPELEAEVGLRKAGKLADLYPRWVRNGDGRSFFLDVEVVKIGGES